MSEDNALVLVAGYQDLDSARHDFQTLVDAAKDKSIPLQGAVLIGKDAEGSPVLVDTGNRLGRRGAAWGAGVGLAIGLFSPALLASAALGAATRHWPAPSPTIGSRPGWPTRSAKRWRRAEQWSSP